MFFGGGGGDPFGGMGGMPQRKAVDTTELYKVLEVEKGASKGEIKKSYYKLARKHHPDKGGDPDTFKKMSAAYDILGDEEKRAIYDERGLEGLEGGGGGGDADDIFSMFFGGGGRGGGRRRQQGPRKSEDVVHPLKVSLEDLYNGRTCKLAVTREVLDGEAKKCQSCDGKGVVIQVVRMGPMIQQIQQHCPQCSGTGYSVKTKRERKVLEVPVEKGMKNNHQIPFRGMADEKPNMEAGDIIFQIKEKPHKDFKRKGNDLLMKKKITLVEALCGFSFSVTALDGRVLVIKSKPGEIIRPEVSEGMPHVQCVENEGMPLHGNPFQKGRLFVVFSIEFPKSFTLKEDQLALLRKALPAAPALGDVGENPEEVDLEDVDLKTFGAKSASEASAYDSDEEGGGGQQGVQCQQS